MKWCTHSLSHGCLQAVFKAMKNSFSVALLLAFSLVVRSQNWFPLSYSLSVGGTQVTDTHRSVLFQNPALSSLLRHAQLGAEYESRYAITELDSKGLRFSYPFSHFTVTADVRYAGFDAYHELLTGIGFSRDFGGRFSMGLQLITESRYAVESDRYYTGFFPQLGLFVPLSSGVAIGFSAYNPFQAQLKYESESRPLPSVYSMGMKLQLSETVEWRIQADQEVSNRLRVGTAVELIFREKFFVQTGVSYHHFFVPSVGVGVEWNRLQFNLISSLHPILGLTIASGLFYRFTR